MFKIGDFSRLTRTSIRMLRHYDEIGLLKPSSTDSITGYRYYSFEQMPRVNRIHVLRQMGFSLSEICGLMQKDLSVQQLRSLLLNRKREIEEEILKGKDKLSRVDTLLKTIEVEDWTMKYDIAIKSIPAFHVLSLRDRIPAYNQEGILWEELQNFVKENKITPSELCFALYHDEAYREADVDVEVVMVIGEDVKGSDRLKVRKLETVPEMVITFHQGPFEEIAAAYQAIGKWIFANNYELGGPSRAIYHKGPWCEEDPANFLTEIQVPVKKV